MASHSGLRFTSKILFLGLIAGAFAGCGTVHYLLQAGKGQLELSNRARPIPDVIKDERTPPKIKEILSEIGAVKKYGEDNLLKPTKNYKDYVKLDRPAVVWVVSACDKLKFEPKKWSFPLVGSFTYLGWFGIEDAKKYGAELKQGGWDVDVRGATAFSTLGWFKDPVLSTMIAEGDEAFGEFVNVILHESVHATYYLSDQSYFNESLASFVADQLTPPYLKKVKGETSPEFQTYREVEKLYGEREKLLHHAYVELEHLYASSDSNEAKLEKKTKILAELQDSLDKGAAGKKVKNRREINNATLVQFRTYGSGMDEFKKLLLSCKNDWPKFWTEIHKITEKSFEHPQQEDFSALLLKLVPECSS